MSDFKTIETQEELDAIVKARIAREREKYSDYDSLKDRVKELENENTFLQGAVEDLKSSKEAVETQISDYEAKISGYETEKVRNRIAMEYGLPLDIANRLQGDDEDSLKADAESLAGFLKSTQPVPPLKDVEPASDDKEAATKQFLKSLTNKGE